MRKSCLVMKSYLVRKNAVSWSLAGGDVFFYQYLQVLSDGSNTNLLFEEIAKEKLEGVCNGNLSSADHHSNFISPIDLAAGCGRKEILQVRKLKV